MVPTAWIYSIQFEFWTPQLHQHLCHHSTCQLNNKTYPLTPDLHHHQYLHWIHATSTNKWLHDFVYATLNTTTFPVHPLLTTSALYWIITNTSTADITRPSYSLLCYLLPFPTKKWFNIYKKPRNINNEEAKLTIHYKYNKFYNNRNKSCYRIIIQGKQ